MNGDLGVHYNSMLHRSGRGVAVGSPYIIKETERNHSTLPTLHIQYDAERSNDEDMLLIRPPDVDDGTGYIYVVTSPLLSALKIGKWRGSLDKLRSRYVTPYGSDLFLMVKWTDDRTAAEADAFKSFADHRLQNELFSKQILPKVVEYMST